MHILALALLLAQSQPQEAQQPQAEPVDGAQFNYYGNDENPPQPKPQPVVVQQPRPRDDEWRHRVHGDPGRQPPPPQYEQPQGPHAAGTIWIAGYWMPRGYDHVWIAGHWAYPPAPGYQWEAARWENVNGAWNFYDGHWYAAQAPQTAVPYVEPPPPMDDAWTAQPPPPPMAEYQPPVPFASAIWIPGYWHWNNLRYAWVAGRWSARPPMYVWEPHRWVRSADGRYREQPGYWRR